MEESGGSPSKVELHASRCRAAPCNNNSLALSCVALKGTWGSADILLATLCSEGFSVEVVFALLLSATGGEAKIGDVLS